MKRIIEEFIPPIGNLASVFHLPEQSIAIQYDGKLYIDYIVQNFIDHSETAFYVGEMLSDGSVIDIIGDASQFPHVFAGWDRKASDEQVAAMAIITPRQARLVLLQTLVPDGSQTLLDAVDALVALQPKDVQLTWEYSTEVQRNNPLITSLLGYLGKSPAEIDELFALGSTL